MIYPFLAAILNTGSSLFEKFIFNHKRKRFKVFVPLLFLFSFLFLIIFFYPFLGEIKIGAFSIFALVLLGVVVITASIRNMLYYYGLQREGLSEIEPFMVFVPLLTIIIASILYPDERNWKVLILAFIAAFALIFSHIEKKHLVFDKGIIPIMGAVFLEAAEANMIKELLYFYSPIAMYTIRVGLVALLLFLVFKPSFKKISKDEFRKLTFVSFLWVLIMIFTYYGYQTVGVVYTVLVLMLAPVLIVTGSYLILKEKKIKRRDIIALIIVMICVIAAQFVK